MGRTESVSFQVHPNDEQTQINMMQRFHWNLLGTQEIKSVDSHLERRGDDIYSVTNSERYVKLSFSRDVEMPHLAEIKKLEAEYNSLPHPDYPALFPVSVWLWVIGALVYGLGLIGWVAYFFLYYTPKKQAADKQAEDNRNVRTRILNEMEKYN